MDLFNACNKDLSNIDIFILYRPNKLNYHQKFRAGHFRCKKLTGTFSFFTGNQFDLEVATDGIGIFY